MIFALWQDFSMLVTNPRNQKLSVQVKDSLGFIHLTVGAGEVTSRLGSSDFSFETDSVITYVWINNCPFDHFIIMGSHDWVWVISFIPTATKPIG